MPNSLLAVKHVINSSEEFCQTPHGHDLFEFLRILGFDVWVINAFFKEKLMGIVFFYIYNKCVLLS